MSCRVPSCRDLIRSLAAEFQSRQRSRARAEFVGFDAEALEHADVVATLAIPVFITQRDLAERWRCSGETIKRRRKRGAIPTYRFGRTVRFALADVMAYEQSARG